MQNPRHVLSADVGRLNTTGAWLRREDQRTLRYRAQRPKLERDGPDGRSRPNSSCRARSRPPPSSHHPREHKAQSGDLLCPCPSTRCQRRRTSLRPLARQGSSAGRQPELWPTADQRGGQALAQTPYLDVASPRHRCRSHPH